MLKRVLIPAVAALAFGAAAAMPQPASANSLSVAAAATQINAQQTSNVIDVRRGRRGHHGHHHHGHHHHHHWRGAYAWSPYYFAPARSCGYRWSYRQHRHVWRCW
jgi:hypothetical protein